MWHNRGTFTSAPLQKHQVWKVSNNLTWCFCCQGCDQRNWRWSCGKILMWIQTKGQEGSKGWEYTRSIKKIRGQFLEYSRQGDGSYADTFANLFTSFLYLICPNSPFLFHNYISWLIIFALFCMFSSAIVC